MSSARRPLRESSVNCCHVVSNSSVGTVKSILGVSQRENIQAGQAPTGAASSNTFKSLPAILSRKRKADSDLNAMTDSEGPASSPLSFYSATGVSSVSSPLNPRLVNGLAACHMSAPGGNTSNLENLASWPNCQQQIQPPPHKQQILSTSTQCTSSSRQPLSALSTNRMQASASSGSVRLMRGGAGGDMSTSPKALAPLSPRQQPNCPTTPSSTTKETPKRTPLSRLNARSENFFKPPPGKKIKLRESWSRFREYVNSSMPKESVRSSRGRAPFPVLRFADRQDLWNVMCKKESGMYVRDPQVLASIKHPNLQPRMRAILVDWLIEVSEVYKLHRETLYLAVDFLDRYLGATREMPRNRLQLVGITCLFVASKIEEIYPPKLREFAFVTDGACSEEEITHMELVVLKGLNWGLSPQTPNRWIKTYMQVNSLQQKKSEVSASPATTKELSEKFVCTQFSEQDYLRAMQLMDLVTLDIGSLAYKYSVLAASVIYHCHDEASALASSGYRWEDIADCVEWMSSYVMALRESGVEAPTLRSFSEVQPDDYHNIQVHTVELSVLEDAQARAQILQDELRSLSSDCNERTLTDDEALDTVSSPSEAQTLGVPPHEAAVLMTPPVETGDRQIKSTGPKGEGKIDNAKNMPAPAYQQSSVFLSPTSEAENSGIW